MLIWIFGKVKQNAINLLQDNKAAGYLELERARVRWFLSLDENDIPFGTGPGKPSTYRSITVDNEAIEFSDGFVDLHTESYRKILAGEGFLPFEVMDSTKIVSEIRHAPVIGKKGEYHPFLEKIDC